jgi:hypothetical protein
MNRAALLMAGLLFTVLLVYLPLAFVARWSGSSPSNLLVLFAALPVLTLLVALLWPRHWVLVGVWPLSHLPVLVLEPDLVGSVVYAGASGFIGFVLLVLAGWAWVILAGRVSQAKSPSFIRQPRPFILSVYLLASSILGAFLLPVFGTLGADHALLTGLVVMTATLVALTVAGKWVLIELGEFMSQPQVRRRWIVAQIRAQRPHPNQWRLSLSMAAITASLVVLLFR